MHLLLREYLPAIQACNRAIELDPQTGLAYHIRGVVFLGLSNPQQGRTDLEHAWKIDPQNATYFSFREWARLCEPQAIPDEAQAMQLHTLAEARTAYPHELHFAHGFLCWTRGQYEDALVAFEQALQVDTDPIQWDTHFWKGVTLASLKREQEARISIQAALKQSMPPFLLSPLRPINPALYQELLAEQP